MKIVSVLENKKLEKRIAITPEIAKKYISLGFDIFLSKNYGLHLGISDKEYLDLGSKISDDNEICYFWWFFLNFSMYSLRSILPKIL